MRGENFQLALERRIVAGLCGVLGGSPRFGHHRVAIRVAVTIESLLAHTEGRHPAAYLVAEIALADRGEAGREDIDRTFQRERLVG